jgi:hypothetical protein
MKNKSTFLVMVFFFAGFSFGEAYSFGGIEVDLGLVYSESVSTGTIRVERTDSLRAIVMDTVRVETTDTLKGVVSVTVRVEPPDTLRSVIRDTIRVEQADTLKAITDTVHVVLADTLQRGVTQQPDTLSRSVREPSRWDRIKDVLVTDFDIHPMKIAAYPGSKVILTDSTNRWNQWIEYSDRLSKTPGVISYRLGGFNRTDYYLMDGRSLSQQRLFVEGMSSVNPVVGYPVYAVMPLERMSHVTQSDLNVSLRSNIEIQKYYVRKPLTRITYDQSTFELRSTDAHISQMLNRQTGIDIAYLGKNNGGEYNRSLTESRQASARIFYNFNSRYLFQALLLYNGIQHQESDGYNIPNMSTFNFSRFFANPVRSIAESSYRNTQVQLSVQRRANMPDQNRANKRGLDRVSEKDLNRTTDPDLNRNNVSDFDRPTQTDPNRANVPSIDAESTDTSQTNTETISENTHREQISTYSDARFMVYHDRTRRFYYASDDTSFYRVLSYHASAMRLIRQNLYTIQAEMRAGYYYLDENRTTSLSVDNWSTLETELNLGLHPIHGINIPVHGRYLMRSDDFTEWESGLGIQFSPFSMFRLGIQAARNQKIPTIQQLYWLGSFRGDTGLLPEIHDRLSVKLEVGREGGAIQSVISAYISEQDRLTVVNGDSIFSQVGGIGQLGGVARIGYHTRRWEMEFSTTLQQYRKGVPGTITEVIAGSGLRIWNRGSIHWKGYLFDNATFVKAGLYGIFSPNSYRTARYIPVADFWDISQIDPEIPGFMRFDAELTARIRTMFVLVRWENFTQGYLEQGYFETAKYPMPSQRLRFGIRVLFSN